MAGSDHDAFWTARYQAAGEAFLFGEAPSAFVRAQAAYCRPGDTVLSVADGEGRNAVWLAEQGCRVTATEISALAVDKARRLAEKRGVAPDFIRADVLDWAWPEAAFDVVLGVFIQFVGPAERARLFDGMCRATRPGGLVLLHGYTPKQLDYRTGGPGAVENLYTPALLREAFAGWEILRLTDYEADLAEGSAHVGRSALIDLVARKPA